MEISKSIGKFSGKTLKGITAAPKATGRKIKAVGKNLAEGYREVVPAKTQNS